MMEKDSTNSQSLQNKFRISESSKGKAMKEPKLNGGPATVPPKHEVIIHRSTRTGIISYHEYRGVFLMPQGNSFRVTRHYWHGAYRPQMFSTIKEAVKYIDAFLDASVEGTHSVSDGFLCVDYVANVQRRQK